MSNMVCGGEMHAASVEQQSNNVFIKSCCRRCVLGRKDTEVGPLCVITLEESGWYCPYMNNFLLDKADSFVAKKFRNRFSCRTPVTRIFFMKLNPTIGSNLGVGTNVTGRNHRQLSCYFLDC